MTDLRSARGSRRPAARRWSTVGAAVAGLALVGTLVPAQAADEPPPRKIVTGWMPYWSTADSIDSVVANKDLFSEVSPFWYSVTWTGSTSAITQQVSASSKTLALSELRAAGVQIVPALTDGMPAGRMAKVLKNTSQRAKLVSRLVDLAVSNNFHGIDLDFEKFAFSDGRASWPTTRPAWVSFIASLSNALHAKGKMLAVTTPPIYNAARASTSGYWVYDWAGISRYVDRLRIMTYDYSVSGYPIAPFYWVENVVKFAVTQVASGKIQVGVAAYGRSRVVNWKPTPTSASVPKIIGTCPTNRPSNYKSIQTFTADSIDSVAPTTATSTATVSKSAAVRTWNKPYQGISPTYETYFSYNITYKGTTAAGASTSCTVYRAGWYDEAKAARARAGLVEKYRLAGIAQWTVGGEDKAQWGSLRTLARSIAPAPTVVRTSAPSSATYGKPVTVTASAKSSGVGVPGATATLYAKAPGAKAWTKLTSATTTSGGYAVFRPTITRNVIFKTVVAGNFERTSGGGASGLVRVRSAMTVAVNATTVPPRARVSMSASLLPKVKGQLVKRQLKQGGRWVTVDVDRTGRAGRASFSFSAPSKAKAHHYRLRAVKTSASLGTTRYIDVRVQ
jgi:spore germination protein YaaH